MISYTDGYNSKLTAKCKLLYTNQSEALCDILDVKRNLLRKVEARYRHGCPLQDLDKSHLYGVDSTVGNSYPPSKF